MNLLPRHLRPSNFAGPFPPRIARFRTSAYAGSLLRATGAGLPIEGAMKKSGLVIVFLFAASFLPIAAQHPDAPVEAALASAAQVSAGSSHTCAVTAAGGVMCWGLNGTWQIGDGTKTDRSTPVDVYGLTSGVAAVAAGSQHTCALTTAGGVKCWGDNLAGQLGDGSGHSNAVPVDVAGLTSGVVAVIAGAYHSCAILASGQAKCWGQNDNGQLGDGTQTSRPTPVDVSQLGLADSISAGNRHTCAVLKGGGLRCWGSNATGQLGNSATVPAQPYPVDVPDLGPGVVKVAAGGSHTCALTLAGGVKCWGWNYFGQLGNGTTMANYDPAYVTGLGSDAVDVATGGSHTCAVTKGGSVRCWGDNYNRQIGDGTTTNRLSPVNVLEYGMKSVSPGGAHTCALTVGGGVKCWGFNYHGQLGIGGKDSLVSPGTVALSAEMTRVSAGYTHTCGLSDSGAVFCWGQNDVGELGDGTQVDRYLPMVVPGLENGARTAEMGESHSCAVTTAGGVKCWGWNQDGQLGMSASGGNQATPIDATGLSAGSLDVSLGYAFSCALVSPGGSTTGVKCWGKNDAGQLGDGTTTPRWLPWDVSGLPGDVQTVSAGQAHACALTAGGAAFCWGGNGAGQVGNGTNQPALLPVRVSGISSGAKGISAGGNHTCAIKKDGRLYCWGLNNWGQLGDGTLKTHWYPTLVSGLSNDIIAVSAGYDHTCALTEAGVVTCWGNNNTGQLGNGTLVDTAIPVEAPGLTGVVALSAGGKDYYGAHTCAVTSAGEIKCWGRNVYGQLGVNPGWTPADVVGFAGDPIPTPTPTPTETATFTPSPSPTAETATPTPPAGAVRTWLPLICR